MRRIFSDENTQHSPNKERVFQHKIHDGSRNVQPCSMNLNTNPIFNSDQKRIGKVLVKPEPLFNPRKHLQLSVSNIKDKSIGDICSASHVYDAKSPSLRKVLFEAEKSRSYKIWDSSLSNNDTETINIFHSHIFQKNNSFDCVPLYNTYNYENKIEKDDYDSIASAMIEDEINGTKPVFSKELEFQELSKLITTKDKIFYYLFGLDNSGYFHLRDKREIFNISPIIKYTSSLAYREVKYKISRSNDNISNCDSYSTSTAETEERIEEGSEESFEISSEQDRDVPYSMNEIVYV